MLYTNNEKIGGYDFTDKDLQWYKEHLGIDENTKIVIPQNDGNDTKRVIATNGKIGGYPFNPSSLIVNTDLFNKLYKMNSAEFNKFKLEHPEYEFECDYVDLMLELDCIDRDTRNFCIKEVEFLFVDKVNSEKNHQYDAYYDNLIKLLKEQESCK